MSSYVSKPFIGINCYNGDPMMSLEKWLISVLSTFFRGLLESGDVYPAIPDKLERHSRKDDYNKCLMLLKLHCF